MAEKVTTMVLKVDLDCHCCYKKVKKVLCKFPQVRNQVYDEKENKVIVTVVCCSPEKIRDKLCCKGGKVIKSIEIKEPSKQLDKPGGVAVPEKPKVAVAPEKPKEPEKPKVAVVPEKPKVVVPEKPKEPEKPKVVVVEKPKEPEKPKPNAKVVDAPPVVKPKELPKPFPAGPPPPEPVKMMEAVPAQGLPQIYPGMPYGGMYYDGSYHGAGGAYYSNFQGYGVPPPPQPSYEGYYYVPGQHGYGHDDGHYRRYESYLTEENPAACAVM